jgi:hypothetical protein
MKQNDDKRERDILGFIKNMTEKNYAQANKYLQVSLEDKMKSRIEGAAKKIGF